MTTYFQQGNLEPFVFQQLKALIDTYKVDPSVPKEERPYVVFDFDNTTIIGDIEENLVNYMSRHWAYYMSAQEFYTTLVPNQQWTTPELMRMAKELTSYYQVITSGDVEPLPAFHALLRHFYLMANQQLERQPGQPWVTYWFKNYTPARLRELTVRMLDEATISERRLESYQHGEIEEEFITGLRYPPELVELYQALQAANIEVYVVSASPIDLVRASANYGGLQVPWENIIAMSYELDEYNRIQPVMQDGKCITKKEGKTQAILQAIAPKHRDQQPIALFGDSMGDYHMMTELKDVNLNVLFNCLNSDKTQLLKTQAKAVYGQEDANIVVQGRDDIYMTLVPTTHSRNMHLEWQY